MAIRRVVTGHDENLKAYIVSDGPAANVRGQREGHSSTLIWATDSAPANITSDEDMGARVLKTAPPPGGTRFCVHEIGPHLDYEPIFHRTDTLDYVLVIKGRLLMRLALARLTLCVLLPRSGVRPIPPPGREFRRWRRGGQDLAGQPPQGGDADHRAVGANREGEPCARLPVREARRQALPPDPPTGGRAYSAAHAATLMSPATRACATQVAFV